MLNKRENEPEKSEMLSELAFCSETMRTVIAPRGSADSKGERMRLAMRKLGWAFSRTRDVWYADDRVSIKPRELRKVEEVSGIKYGQQQVRELDQLISTADAFLYGHDADFYRAFVDAFREALRSVARARTEG